MRVTGPMRLSGICLLLAGMIFSQGCIQSVAAIVQAGAQAGSLYLTATKPPVQIRTAECGNIEPIYPDDGYQERLTEDEKNQIVAQAVRLKELCPE